MQFPPLSGRRQFVRQWTLAKLEENPRLGAARQAYIHAPTHTHHGGWSRGNNLKKIRHMCNRPKVGSRFMLAGLAGL